MTALRIDRQLERLPTACGYARPLRRDRATSGVPVSAPEDDVLGDGHRVDEHEVLVDHADAQRDGIVRPPDLADLAVDQNLAAVGRVEAIGDPHGRRLARAVLADDGVDGAGLDRDVDVVVGEDAAETLRDVSELGCIYWNIASVTLISPAMIFRLASSAALMASGDSRSLLYSSTE